MKIKRHPKHDEWAAFVNNHQYGSPFQHPDCFALFYTFGKLKPVAILHYDIDDYIDGVITAYPCSFLPTLLFIPHALIAVNGPLTDEYYPKADVQMLQSDLLCSATIFKRINSPVIEVREMNGMPVLSDINNYNSEYLNVIKDISSGEQILLAMKKARQRGIRKIKRDGFITETVFNKEELRSFIKLLHKHYLRLRKPYISHEVIRGIANTTHDQESFRVVVTKKESRVCGGAILGFCRDTCYEWYIVSDRAVRDSGTAVTYGAMEYALEMGYKKFDFMGIGKQGVDYGVRDFKMGFGGEVIEYKRYRL